MRPDFFCVNRLSELAGRDVVFELKALPYGRVQDIKRLQEDSQIHILLAGCVSPDLKDSRLAKKYYARTAEGKAAPELTTPADVVKNMLLAGEIQDLANEVERLTGYRSMTISEVKND